MKEEKVRNQTIYQLRKITHSGSVLSLEVEVKGSNLEIDREKFRLCD